MFTLRNTVIVSSVHSVIANFLSFVHSDTCIKDNNYKEYLDTVACPNTVLFNLCNKKTEQFLRSPTSSLFIKRFHCIKILYTFSSCVYIVDYV